MTRQHRFVVLGTGGIFTFHVLKTLLDESFLPLAYIQSGAQILNDPARFADIELQFPRTGNELTDLLASSSIPFYYQSTTAMENLIQKMEADYLLVACWPELISPEIISSVSIAALNLHPSLLPKYRGFDPVGDQLKNGDLDFGISLHLLTEHFDEGDIVLQKGLSLGANPSASDINKVAAIQGANLFVQAIRSYHHPGWALISQQMP